MSSSERPLHLSIAIAFKFEKDERLLSNLAYTCRPIHVGL